jgi:phosphate uptake regulator
MGQHIKAHATGRADVESADLPAEDHLERLRRNVLARVRRTIDALRERNWQKRTVR